MSHQRQLIRDAVATALISASTAAEDRVFTTRLTPFRAPLLPAIGVWTLEEDVDPASAKTAPRELKRHPRLAIEAVVRNANDGDIDDQLDDLALAIEVAIAKDDTLGGTASDCWLMKTEFEFGNQGDMEIAVARLIFYVTYFQYAPDAADAVLDDLKTIDTKYSLANTQATADQAEDTLQNLDA